MVGVSGWTIYLQSNIWESKGLPLGEINVVQLVYAQSRCSPFERTQLYLRASNSHNERFEITHRPRPIKKQSNTIIHASGNIGVVFLCFSFLSISFSGNDISDLYMEGNLTTKKGGWWICNSLEHDLAMCSLQIYECG